MMCYESEFNHTLIQTRAMEMYQKHAPGDGHAQGFDHQVLHQRSAQKRNQQSEH